MTKTKRLNSLNLIKLQLMVRGQRRASAARSATLPKILTLKMRILINRMTSQILQMMEPKETVPLDNRINITVDLAEGLWELSMIQGKRLKRAKVINYCSMHSNILENASPQTYSFKINQMRFSSSLSAISTLPYVKSDKTCSCMLLSHCQLFCNIAEETPKPTT